MSMSELLDIIEANGKGVRAYIECSLQARLEISAQPKSAAMYFLLAIAADRFAESFDDQPLLSQKAEDEYLRFKEYVTQFEQAEADGSDAARLSAINAVSRQIAEHRFHGAEDLK